MQASFFGDLPLCFLEVDIIQVANEKMAICHGSTILLADFLRRRNHIHKAGR